MEYTFIYKFETNQYGDEYDYDEFRYTPNEDRLKLAVVDELFFTYFRETERKLFTQEQRIIIKNALKNLTDDNDNWEELIDDYESDLKERFRDDAYEKYKDRGKM